MNRNRDAHSDGDHGVSRVQSPPKTREEDSSPAEGSASPKNEAPPRLATLPEEEMKPYSKGPNAKIVEKQLIRTVNDAQHSWGNVWKTLHASPGQQHRGKLEMNLQTYYQGATWSLSEHVPLVYGTSQSRFASHQSMLAHEAALRPARSTKCGNDGGDATATVGLGIGRGNVAVSVR